jgi:hypothetical protein
VQGKKKKKYQVNEYFQSKRRSSEEVEKNGRADDATKKPRKRAFAPILLKHMTRKHAFRKGIIIAMKIITASSAVGNRETKIKRKRAAAGQSDQSTWVSP